MYGKNKILQVIPRAVLYFTGDIFGDDDEDFEDCEDEDSEEEEDWEDCINVLQLGVLKTELFPHPT